MVPLPQSHHPHAAAGLVLTAVALAAAGLIVAAAMSPPEKKSSPVQRIGIPRGEVPKDVGPATPPTAKK